MATAAVDLRNETSRSSQGNLETRSSTFPGEAPLLDSLTSSSLDSLAEALKAHANASLTAARVDGLIIGTGEADFTKGNVPYPLTYKGKVFQLIDVPGIEGDEAKYAEVVREAIAKAHLVLYVNGTNKKPEKATAEKIRSYLRRGTKVCPLINVRANADAYEFPEDREGLGAGEHAALQQTVQVLESVLGPEILLPGHCVQGLLGFSSLAYHAKTGRTSIHPARDKDLVIQQRNYKKHFGSPKAMYEFSQLKSVAKVLHDKLGSFREDIIESNKEKVVELLGRTAAELTRNLEEHYAFLASVNPEFGKCRKEIKNAIASFERVVRSGRQNALNEFYDAIIAAADETVEDNLGNKEVIKEKIEKAFGLQKKAVEIKLEKLSAESAESLEARIKKSINRLSEDVQRTDFQTRVAYDLDAQWAGKGESFLGGGFDFRQLGSIALSVLNYAFTGFKAGSSIPGPGNIIGTVVGLVVGIGMSVLQIFLGREKRVRIAQAQIRKGLDEQRIKTLDASKVSIEKMVEQLKEQVRLGVLEPLEELRNNLEKPLDVLTKQIASLTEMQNKIEQMPYGTIEKV